MLQLNCIELFSLKACYLMQLHGKKKKIKKIKCLAACKLSAKVIIITLQKILKAKRTQEELKNLIFYCIFCKSHCLDLKVSYPFNIIGVIFCVCNSISKHQIW